MDTANSEFDIVVRFRAGTEITIRFNVEGDDAHLEEYTKVKNGPAQGGTAGQIIASASCPDPIE